MNKSMKKGKKYIFTLYGVNIEKINYTYGIKSQEIQNIPEYTQTTNTTNLTELNTERGAPEIISFLDESKHLHSCNVSMIDFQSKMDVILLRYHCYWCRHPFDNRPIGCPINYISSKAEKRYHSHISRDTYTIKESITVSRRMFLEKEDNISVEIGEYYETDGVFCSFNCCQSWIDDNKHNRMYDHSTILLMKMYNNIMGTRMTKISPAPHWRVLETYGGHLNIIRFRDGFNKVDYEYHGNTKPLPNFLPLGTLFEEKIKF